MCSNVHIFCTACTNSGPVSTSNDAARRSNTANVKKNRVAEWFGPPVTIRSHNRNIISIGNIVPSHSPDKCDTNQDNGICPCLVKFRPIDTASAGWGTCSSGSKTGGGGGNLGQYQPGIYRSKCNTNRGI